MNDGKTSATAIQPGYTAPLYIHKPGHLRQFFLNIYNEIQGSRAVRRDAGFETGPTIKMDGTPWFRNVDELPSFEDWFTRNGDSLDLLKD